MHLAVELLKLVGEGIFFYYFIQLAFYIYHRLLHMPISGPLYRAHHVQHHKLYFPLRRLRTIAYGLDPAEEKANSRLLLQLKANAQKTLIISGEAKGNQSVDKGTQDSLGERQEAPVLAAKNAPAQLRNSQQENKEQQKQQQQQLSSLELKEHLKSSDGWFKSGGELLFGIPMLAVAVWALRLLPTSTAIVFIGVMVFVAVWGDVMHSSFHLYDDAISHPESLAVHQSLVSAPWFRKYQHLHDIHHAHTNANFGFFDFTIDKLFGTYCETRPSYLPVPPTKLIANEEKDASTAKCEVHITLL